MRPPEPARNARFRFNCRIPLVRASSGREGRGRAPLTAPAPRPPRQSQSFFRGYGSSLPTSLTHVPPLGQRLRTLRTCCGYRYDRGAAPRRRRLRRRRAGPLAFHGPSGALRRGRSARRRRRRRAAPACRAQATHTSGGRPVHTAARSFAGQTASGACPLPPARTAGLRPSERRVASERADNSSRGPRRRRQRPCRGVAALCVQQRTPAVRGCWPDALSIDGVLCGAGGCPPTATADTQHLPKAGGPSLRLDSPAADRSGRGTLPRVGLQGSSPEYSLLPPRSALAPVPRRLAAERFATGAPRDRLLLIGTARQSADGRARVARFSALHFQGRFIRPVSCYTLLSGFRLPWPPSGCLNEPTPFLGSG